VDDITETWPDRDIDRRRLARQIDLRNKSFAHPGGGRCDASAVPKDFLPAIGFWSYTRVDDDVDDKPLSRLRVRVERELRGQLGRSVKIFQDVTAISPGAIWERETQRAVDEATIFIPIVTPSFLHSAECMREVRMFLERQQRLIEAHPELHDLTTIFPIHYNDADPIYGLVSRTEDADLRKALKAHHWSDFRELRHEPDSSPQVKQWVARFAAGMRPLLMTTVERPEPAPQSPPPPSLPPKPAPAPRPRPTSTKPEPDKPSSPWTAGGSLSSDWKVGPNTSNSQSPSPSRPWSPPAQSATPAPPPPQPQSKPAPSQSHSGWVSGESKVGRVFEIIGAIGFNIGAFGSMAHFFGIVRFNPIDLGAIELLFIIGILLIGVAWIFGKSKI
jgi:hypothetical protein